MSHCHGSPHKRTSVHASTAWTKTLIRRTVRRICGGSDDIYHGRANVELSRLVTLAMCVSSQCKPIVRACWCMYACKADTCTRKENVNSEGVYMYTCTDQSLFERSRVFLSQMRHTDKLRIIDRVLGIHKWQH